MVIVHGAEHYVSPRWLPSLVATGDVEGIVAGSEALPDDARAVRTASWMREHPLPAAQRRADLLVEVGPAGTGAAEAVEPLLSPRRGTAGRGHAEHT